ENVERMKCCSSGTTASVFRATSRMLRLATGLSQCIADSGQQLVALERLREDTVAPGERRQALQSVGIAGDQDGRQSGARRVDESQELEAVHVRHVDIRDEAVDLRQATAVEECGGGAEGVRSVVSGFEKIFDRSQNAVIVVDH